MYLSDPSEGFTAYVESIHIVVNFICLLGFQIMFEHLGAPAMYLANQLVLSLYASGLTVGMCLSSGFSVTQAAAIYEGYLLAHTVQELDIGGQSLTDNLQKLLRDNKGQNFHSSSGWQIVNNMKETMAYVAQGNIITTIVNLYSCTETRWK